MGDLGVKLLQVASVSTVSEGFAPCVTVNASQSVG